jgi:hypothetical protein
LEKDTMIEIGNTIISLDIIEIKFACNINACKGICCIEGDSGAPITKEEETQIKEITPKIIQRLNTEAQQKIEKQGISFIDEEGDLVTSILDNSGACVFMILDDNGNAKCAIEEAWENKEINLRKPISCHLYPIRITSYNSFDAINYHSWDICKDAIIRGEKLGIPVYKFAKDALIRKYGNEWYKQLVWAAENLLIKQ